MNIFCRPRAAYRGLTDGKNITRTVTWEYVAHRSYFEYYKCNIQKSASRRPRLPNRIISQVISPNTALRQLSFARLHRSVQSIHLYLDAVDVPERDRTGMPLLRSQP